MAKAQNKPNVPAKKNGSSKPTASTNQALLKALDKKLDLIEQNRANEAELAADARRKSLAAIIAGQKGIGDAIERVNDNVATIEENAQARHVENAETAKKYHEEQMEAIGDNGFFFTVGGVVCMAVLAVIAAVIVLIAGTTAELPVAVVVFLTIGTLLLVVSIITLVTVIAHSTKRR